MKLNLLWLEERKGRSLPGSWSFHPLQDGQAWSRGSSPSLPFLFHPFLCCVLYLLFLYPATVTKSSTETTTITTRGWSCVRHFWNRNKSIFHTLDQGQVWGKTQTKTSLLAQLLVTMASIERLRGHEVLMRSQNQDYGINLASMDLISEMESIL